MKARKKELEEALYSKDMTREKRRKLRKDFDEEDDDFDWENSEDWDSDFPEFK